MKIIFLIIVLFCTSGNAFASHSRKKSHTENRSPISFFSYPQIDNFSKIFETEDENIVVHAKRPPLYGTFSVPSSLRQFDDGHTEREVELMHNFRIKVRMGEETDRDPVTGTNLKPFGEAYANSNPITPR